MQHWRPVTFILEMSRTGKLFWALLVLLLAAPVARMHPAATILYQIWFTAVLLIGVYAVSQERVFLRSGVAFAVASAVGNCMAMVGFTPLTGALALGTSALFYGHLALGLLRHVSRQRRVTADTLYSAVNVYLLAIAFWSLLYLFVEVLAPSSIKGALTPDPPLPMSLMDALYFSCITMTTIGFGDITPASTAARLLVSLEGLFGVIYPTIVIARLVGMYTVTEEPEEPAED